MLHRYQHGPADEALFDQAFDQLGQETNLLLPLGDHQNSTRVVLGNVPNGAVTIRQSVDYAPFGRIAALKDANGQPTLSALDTVFGHHGSIQDPATDLQLKGARWYSPDLGRFVSVDPIQDGANWYAFAGNDPVNYADPSGLSTAFNPVKSLLGAAASILPGASTILNGARALAPYVADAAPWAGQIGSNLASAGSYALQANAYGALQGSLQTQIAGARQTLANRSWYEVIDKLSDRGRIADLTDQLVDAVGRESAAGDNFFRVLQGNWRPASTYASYDYQTYGEGLQAEGGYGYGVGQVFAGYGDAVAGAANAAYQTARHALVAAQGVYTAFRHPILTGQAIVDQLGDLSQSVRGQGQIVGDVLTGIVTGGALKALKQTQVAQKVIDASAAAARNAVDLAARVRIEPFGTYSVPPIPKSIYLAPRSFGSFDALKRSLGPAGEGRVYHHIVEQRGPNVERFGAEAIHNTDNVVPVAKAVNQSVADYYSRKRDFTGGQTVRQWLNSQSYAGQAQFGRRVLELAQQGKPLP